MGRGLTAAETTSRELDVEAVRRRFTALDRPLAFFDGPGGTQCPDAVIDAVGAYMRESNANVGAPYETSRRTDEVVEAAHERAASFLGCEPAEVAFGQSMTALNFLLTRALARGLEAGDEVLVTRLDHDANVAPWLALVVFATWKPWRVLVGAYLFGSVTLAQFQAQAAGVDVPSQLLAMLPYVATILVLAIISRDAMAIRLNAPASLGKPYHPE